MKCGTAPGFSARRTNDRRSTAWAERQNIRWQNLQRLKVPNKQQLQLVKMQQLQRQNLWQLQLAKLNRDQIRNAESLVRAIERKQAKKGCRAQATATVRCA